ncbi:MAG: hypothetical protein LBP54_06570 [Campylobacteraceae bacterium]|nr:hypothetical protein [Campylobacteraceae bacterium]
MIKIVTNVKISLMNEIILDYIPPPIKKNCGCGEEIIAEPLLKILIDGEDLYFLKEFEHRYEAVTLCDFIFTDIEENKDYDCINGDYTIGICFGCRCEGCDDLYINIKTLNGITTWEIIPDRLENIRFIKKFDTNKYSAEIKKIKEYFLSYVWEDEKHKTERLCNEFIRQYMTKNGLNIEGVDLEYNKHTNQYSQNMKVDYWDDWKHEGNAYSRAHKSFNLE